MIIPINVLNLGKIQLVKNIYRYLKESKRKISTILIQIVLFT